MKRHELLNMLVSLLLMTVMSLAPKAHMLRADVASMLKMYESLDKSELGTSEAAVASFTGVADDGDIADASDAADTDAQTNLSAWSDSSVLRQYAVEVFDLVNIERNKAGLAAFTFAEPLCVAASVRAKEVSEYFSHVRPDGSRCFTVMDDLDIVFFSCGENIAASYQTPEDAVSAWMKSTGHRNNILSSDYYKLGVGVYESASGELYWVQIFTN